MRLGLATVAGRDGEEASERRTATKRGCRHWRAISSGVERSATVPYGRQHRQVKATNRLTVSSLQARVSEPELANAFANDDCGPAWIGLDQLSARLAS